MFIATINLPRLATFSSGPLSKYELSFFIYLNNSGSMTKKPPFIHPSSRLDFSLKYLTTFFLILIAPNLAGGLTAVRVTIVFFFVCEMLPIFLNLHYLTHLHKSLKRFLYQDICIIF